MQAVMKQGCGRSLRRLEKRWLLQWGRPRRGMNILDNMYSLGMVAVLLIVVLTTGLYVRSLYQEQRATFLLTQLVQAVSSTYQSTRTYGDDTDLIPVLNGFGRLPEEFKVVDGSDITLEHPFGGPVLVTGGPGGETNRYMITFDDLDDDICAALSEKTSGRSRGRSGLAEVEVNDSDMDLPYTPAEAETACDEGSAANKIEWVYF